MSSNNVQSTRRLEVEPSDVASAEGAGTLETALSHLSPVSVDESGIAIAVNEVGRYATLDFEVPSGLPLTPSARARLEALRDRRIEYTGHNDRAFEEWLEVFPATAWNEASPFVRAVRDARRDAQAEITHELRTVALDYLATTVREAGAESDVLRALRRIMLRDGV
ncbi:hypothetical protein [Microbacterium sp. NPDC089696]|uniref:hypothetical protein n=1 Tax=Microbacterium sp. NPDC089696 TaxID=3364199 RepID=UPI0038058CEB